VDTCLQTKLLAAKTLGLKLLYNKAQSLNKNKNEKAVRK
jgi:hypothetical protein